MIKRTLIVFLLVNLVLVACAPASAPVPTPAPSATLLPAPTLTSTPTPKPTPTPEPTATPTEVSPQVLVGDAHLIPIEDAQVLEQEGFAPIGPLDSPSLTEAIQTFQQQIGAGVIGGMESDQPAFYYHAEQQFAHPSWLPQQFSYEGRNLSLTEFNKDVAVYTDETGQRYVIGLSDYLPELNFKETKVTAGSIAISDNGLHTIYVTESGEIIIRTHQPMRVEEGYTLSNLSLPPYRESPVIKDSNGKIAYIYNPVDGEWQMVSEQGQEVLQAIEQFLAIPEPNFRASLRQMKLWREEYERYNDYQPRDGSKDLKPLTNRRITEPYLGLFLRTNTTDKTIFYYSFSGAFLGVLPVKVDLTAFPEGYQTTADTVNILVMGYEVAPHQRGIIMAFLGEDEAKLNYKELHCNQASGCRFGIISGFWVREVRNVITDLSDKPIGAPIIFDLLFYPRGGAKEINPNNTTRSLVLCQVCICGYKRLRRMRASAVVNCQSTPFCASLRC